MDKKPTYEELEQRIAALKAEIATFKEAEEKFRSIFHDSLDALMIIDSNNGHILAVNETTVQMLGYEESGLVGKHFSILFPPATRQQGRELLGKLKVHGAVFTQDFLNSAGSVCMLDLTATLIPWGKGRAILANLRDIAERKRIDDAIRRAKKEWERTFDSVPDLISIIDKEHRIIRLNKTMSDRIGVTPQEAIGQTCYSLLHGTSEPPEFCPHVKLLADGREHKVEIHVERLGGDFLVSASPLNDTEGKTVGCVHVVHDITDRVMAEKRLRNSKEKYQDLYRLMRLIADNVPDLIWAKELDGRFLFVNQAMCDRLLMCGSPDKAVGKTDIFFAEQEKIAGYEHSFGEICVDSDAVTMKKKRPGRFVEDGFVRGKYLVLDVHKAPLLDENGEMIGTVGCGRDITKEREIELALRASEERFRELAELLPETIFEMDMEGNLTFVNRSIFDHFGYTKEDFDRGMNGYDMLVPEDRQQAMENAGRMLAGERIGLKEYTGSRKDGTTFPAILDSSTIFREEKPVGIRGFIIDITEKKHLETQLQQAQKMEAIGTLAGGIAHDFNNLLMAVQGNASLMLLKKDPSHPDHERLKNIEQYVQKGAELTKQLLGFARGGKYDVRPVDLNDIIKKSSEMFGRTKKEVVIHAKYQEGIFAVEADQGQIEQVLLNLFVNAWQAMPGGGNLYLETENVALDRSHVKPYHIEPGRYVKMSMTDTGVGMDEATRQRIFDPFFTTKEMGGGTGLGLASVYGIVKNHSGIIDVYSEKGHGTTFNIYLPATESGVIDQKSEVTGEDVTPGHETIILVDDEEMVAQAGRDMLEEIGYTVFLAINGKEAVNIYQEKRDEIDMVILDMIMPGMGGGECYDRLKAINPDIKALLSSGYSIDGEATEILDRGCDGFIQKPFNLKQLSQKLREILDKK